MNEGPEPTLLIPLQGAAMRYALISDVHANLPALEAVLNSIASRPESGLPEELAQHLRTGGIPPDRKNATHGR